MSLRESIPLQKRKIIKKSIWAILFIPAWLLIFLLFPTVRQVYSQNPRIFIGASVLAPIIFFGIPIYEYFYFRRYYYDINLKNIIIRKGAIAQKEITLPFTKITDVYVDQDLLDVIFKIYDVHISTPTAESGEFAHIDGVNKEDSLKLKKMILDEINKDNT